MAPQIPLNWFERVIWPSELLFGTFSLQTGRKMICIEPIVHLKFKLWLNIYNWEKIGFYTEGTLDGFCLYSLTFGRKQENWVWTFGTLAFTFRMYKCRDFRWTKKYWKKRRKRELLQKNMHLVESSDMWKLLQYEHCCLTNKNFS